MCFMSQSTHRCYMDSTHMCATRILPTGATCIYPQHRCATCIIPTAHVCYMDSTHRCYMERSGRQEIGGNGSFCRPQIINGQFLAPCNSLQRHKYTNTGLTFPKCALHQCSIPGKMIFGSKSLHSTDFVFVFCT